MSTIQNKKTPVCSRCGYEISWDKTAREMLGTRNPVTPDKTRIHECDYDKDGNLKIKPGFEEQSKKNYEAYLAKKNAAAGGTVVSTPTPSTNTQGEPTNIASSNTNNDGNAAIASIMNNPENTAIKVALAEILNKFEKLMQEQEEWKAKVVSEVYAMEQTVNRLDTVVGEFIRYNPIEYSLRGFMSELMPKVDWQSFKEKSAMDKLENQKEDPTFQQQEEEDEREEQPGEDPQ